MKAAVIAPRLYLVCLLLLALLSAALRSRPGYVLAGGDTFFVEPRPAVVLERDPYLWTDSNAGTPSTNAVQLPYRLWWALAGKLAIAPWLFQTLERGLYLAGAGLAMFLLARAVWPGRPWAPVAASAFYMFNVGRLSLELIVHLEWLYVLLPLMLMLYWQMTRRLYAGAVVPAVYWGLALAAIVGLAFPVILINLPQAVIVAGACTALAAAASLLAPRAQRARTLAVNGLVGALAVLLSAWWLWPTVQYYVLSLSQGQVAAVTNPLDWSSTQVRSSFLNELLLVPQWSWGPDFVSVFNVYQQPLMRVLILVPALAVAGAFWARRSRAERRASLVLGAFLLLLLFLGKGVHLPGTSLNQLADLYVPGFWLLREPWGKIFCFVVLVLALLVGLTLDELIGRLSGSGRRTRLAALLALPLLGLFPLSVYPLFVRDALYRASTLLPSPQIQIPGYWYEAAAALGPAAQEGRILLAPGNNFYSMPYTWGGYFADGLADRLLPMSTLSRDFGYIRFNAGYTQMLDAVYQALENPTSTVDPTQALALLNVRYVLVRGDISEDSAPLGGPVPDPRLAVIRARLRSLPGLELHLSFGALEFYRLTDEHFLPRIYVPDRLAVFDQPADLVTNTAAQTSLARPVYLARADAIRSDLMQATRCQPRLTFNQIDPTRYDVQVEGDCADYLLVFSSGYDSNWQATVRRVDGTSAPVSAIDHVRANGYANAWHIQQTGSHIITIEYRPQRWFAVSVLISAVGLGLAVAVLGLAAARRRPARGDGADP